MNQRAGERPRGTRPARQFDLAGVRRGDAHLDRARELDPTITSRPVPVQAIINAERAASMQKLTYTVQEAAALVGYAAETIRRAIRFGDLKAAGGGKGDPYRISGVELERWWRDVKGGGDLFPAEQRAGEVE